MGISVDTSKVLIVDDNRSNIYAFQSILRAPNLDLITAESGEGALQALIENPDVALVLMDVQMPGMDGFETTELIRGQPRFRDLPILFITAVYKADDFARMGYKIGASDYITKPVDNDILEGKVNIFLTLQNQKRQLAREVAERETAEKRLAHLNTVLNAVRDINQLITREKDRTRLMRGACDALIRTRGYYGVWMMAWDTAEQIQAYAESGWKDSRPQVLSDIVGDVAPPCAAWTADSALLDTTDALPDECGTCPMAAEWCTPDGISLALRHDERSLGRMALAAMPGVAIDDEEIAMLREVADDLGLALHGVELEEARRRAEEALRRSQNQFQDLYDNAPTAYFTIGGDGRLQRCNRRAVELLGYSSEELIGRPVLDLCADTPSGQAAAAKLMAQFQAGLETTDGVVQMKRADGSLIWASVTVSALRAADGQIVEGRASIVDISQRVEGEAERSRLLGQIQAQARQIQQVIDTVPDGVILLGPSHQVILANPTGERYLTTLTGAGVGDRIDSLASRPMAEILTSPPRGLWHEVVVGSEVYEVIARQIESGITSSGWVLVVHEATAERQAQRQIQQQERLAAVGQLASGIAHDFNNIMAVIILEAQISIQVPNVPPRIRERLATMNSQARLASDLITQILDFSRSSVLTKQTLDLLPLIKEQVKLLDRTLPEHIEIRLQSEPGSYLVNAEPTRIQQVLMNLALNARDAMPSGGKLDLVLDRLQVDRSATAPLPQMQQGTWIRLVVADQGTGIPDDVMPHVFEPFYTTKPRGQGTGLGLAQVWGIIAQHEGHIDVSSQPGQGTRFTIYLPAVPLGIVSEVTQAQRAAFVTGNQERILLVEDNDAVRVAVSEALTTLGYHVIPTTDGHEALEVLTMPDTQIALVLSDAVMPGMGGIQLFHTLRDRGDTVPMIVMSGHSMKHDLETLLDEGLGAWINKPPRLEQLAEVIAEVLAK